MKKKTALVSILFVVLLSGCASQYANKQLQSLLNKMGFKTIENDKGVVVFLPEVYFEFDSSRLTDAAQGKLTEISAILTDPRAASRNILIEGHTDSIGSDDYNERLSFNRASAVAVSLMQNGVDDSRLTRRGYGKKYPIAPNKTEDGRDNPEGRAQNRRVEVIIVDDK